MPAPELSELSGRWRWLIEAHPVPMVVADAAGPLVWSRAAEALFGSELPPLPEGIVHEHTTPDGLQLCGFPLVGGTLFGLRRGPRITEERARMLAVGPPGDLLLIADSDGRICHGSPAVVALLGPVQGRHLIEVLPIPASFHLDSPAAALQRVGSAEDTRRLRWTGSRVAVEDTEVWLLRATDVTASLAGQLELTLKMRRTETLHTISLAIGADASLVDVARLAADRLVQILPLREVRVAIWDETPRYLLCNRDGAVVSVPMCPTMPEALRQGEPMVTLGALDPVAQSLGVRATVLVPLSVRGEIGGAIELYTDVKDRLDEPELELARAVAALVATALVRARASDRLARHAEVLERRISSRNEEIHRAQIALAQAERFSRIGELSANAMHELNQPLHVLAGYLELLEDGELEGEARARALGVMRRAVTRMGALVEALRGYARAGGGRFSRVNLRRVAELGRDLTAGATEERVVTQLADVEVLGDQAQLEQVLINLLANGLQSAPDRVTVRVFRDERREDRAGRAAGVAVIEVADHGPGVPAAMREQVFEPFFTTRGAGMGLGLSVSRRIVELHGGTIRVVDTPGGGATFRVELPEIEP